jgi:hypothetical protein
LRLHKSGISLVPFERKRNSNSRSAGTTKVPSWFHTNIGAFPG